MSVPTVPPVPRARRTTRSRRRRGVARLRFRLANALFVLPNLFTLASIFCGFYAIVIASGAPGPRQLHRASLAIFFSILFDMADGRVARLTRTQSAFGTQLDSLADVVSFGVAPAVLAYRWALASWGPLGMLVSFAYIASGAMRLARFNVLAARSETEASSYFLGLPIPLSAGLLSSAVMVAQRAQASPAVRLQLAFCVLVGTSLLMVSNVRYRTFKRVAPTRQGTLAAAAGLVAFALLARFTSPAVSCLTCFVAYVAMGLGEGIWAVVARWRRYCLSRAASHSSEGPKL